MFGEVSKFVEKVETIEVGDLGDDGNEREFELWGACENNIVIKSDDRYNRDNLYQFDGLQSCHQGHLQNWKHRAFGK